MSEEPKRRIYVRAFPDNMWATLQQLINGKWMDEMRYPVEEGPDGAFTVFWMEDGANPIEVVSTTEKEPTNE